MSAPDVPVIVPPIELNRESLESLRGQLEPLLLAEAGGPGVVLDLEKVTFINSTALGYVVHVGKELAQHGRRVALARPQRKIEKLLRVVGLHMVLPHFKTIPEATRHVGGAASTA